MTTRRTEITVETERLLVAHSRQTTRVWCVRCGLEIETVAGFDDDSTHGAAQNTERNVAAAGGRNGGPVKQSGDSSPRS